MLEAFGLIVYWNLVGVGEVNGDDAVVLKKWQAFSVVEQSLKKTGGVLLDLGLANLPPSLPFFLSIFITVTHHVSFHLELSSIEQYFI